MFGIAWCCRFRRIYLPAHFLNGGHKRISLDGQGEVVVVPRSVAWIAAGTVIQCRPILIVERTLTRGGRHPRGCLPPFLLAHRWPERGSTGWQFRHECVPIGGGVVGAGSCRVGGGGAPRHVGPATSAHRDVVAEIATRSPQEGGVGQIRARRVELRHERVTVAVEHAVVGPGGGGVVVGGGAVRDVGVATFVVGSAVA